MKKLLLIFATMLSLYAGDSNPKDRSSRTDPKECAAYYCCCPYSRNPDQTNLTQSRSGQNSAAEIHRLSVLNSQLLVVAIQGHHNESPCSESESD